MERNDKGFTLIELLAVIIILGVLMIIAIPSVTEYIQSSRKDAYITTALQYVSGARNKVNSAEIPLYDTSITYYIPTNCISLESGGDSPFGKFTDSYVVVTYDGNGYDYYWTSKDSSNMGVLLASENLLNNNKVLSGITSVDTSVGVGERDKILILNDCEVETAIEQVATYNIEEKGELTEKSNIDTDNNDSENEENPSNPVVLKNFQIFEESEYVDLQYEEGMTWLEWLYSPYNTIFDRREDSSIEDGTFSRYYEDAANATRIFRAVVDKNTNVSYNLNDTVYEGVFTFSWGMWVHS